MRYIKTENLQYIPEMVIGRSEVSNSNVLLVPKKEESKKYKIRSFCNEKAEFTEALTTKEMDQVVNQIRRDCSKKDTVRYNPSKER
jgi:hypothetical protein